jgi:hypothetical protein
VRHPAAQPLGRHVHQFDLVGSAYDLIGQGLVLRHSGDLLDHVVEGFQVLDVQRGDHVDAGVEECLDVLPAFGVAALAGHVGVRELVDDRHLRAPGEQRGEVHILEQSAAVGAGRPGDAVRAVEHRLGVRAPVALREPHHHVRPAGGTASSLVEHAVGLADSRGSSEVDLQSSGPSVTHRRRRAPLTGSTPLSPGFPSPKEALSRAGRRGC